MILQKTLQRESRIFPRLSLILFIAVYKYFFYFNGCSQNATENVSNFQRHYYINLVLTFKIKDMPYIKREREREKENV